MGLVYEDVMWPMGVSVPHSWWLTWPSRSFTLLTYTWTPSLVGMHVAQLGFHLVTALLLVAVVWPLAGLRVAWLAGAVFLGNPIQIETVSYLTARTDLLCTLWILVALWCVLQPRGWLAVGGTALALGLAGFSKELGVVGVPMVVWSVLRWRPARGVAVLVLCALGLLEVIAFRGALLLTWWQQPAMWGGSLWTPGAYLWLQTCAIGRLLWVAVSSTGLSIDHDPVGSSLAWGLLPCLLVIAGWVWRQQRVVVWAIGLVVLALLPRLAIQQREFVSEHQLYLAMIGLSTLIGVGIDAVWTWATRSRPAWPACAVAA